MSVQKFKTKNGEIRYAVRVRVGGRGSKRSKRVFDRLSDAEAFDLECRLAKKNQNFASPIANSDTTFAKEADIWLQLNQSQFSESHRKNVEVFLKRLVPDYGHLKPENFHHGLLTEIQGKLLGQDLSPATVNRHLQVILAVLNFSVEQKRIGSHPIKKYKKLKETRKAVGFWSFEEAQSFLKFTDQKYPLGSDKRWIYVVYLAALNTAARAGELWALRPRDFTSSGELILIERQFNKALQDFSHTKTKKDRQVPCNVALLKELKALIQRNHTKDHETIFMNSARQPVYHDNFVKRIFAKDMKEWGGKRIRFHDLRHTATTLMVASGVVDVKTVQDICGHDKVVTTMNYVHRLAEKIKETGRKFSVLPTFSESELPPSNAQIIPFPKPVAG